MQFSAIAKGPELSFGAESRKKGLAWFPLVVSAFLIYAALFIYRTSFVINGERYFSLFDDAMISMRYARNLAHGYGLVWNPGGERIQGYTNPLWVLYMSFVHLFPIPASKVSLVIQATAALLLACNLYFVRKLALDVSNGSEAVALGAVMLTAFYFPINNWALQGMEVSVLVLVMTVCAWLAVRCMQDFKFPSPLYVLLGVSILIRPDMVVTSVALIIFLAIFDPINRRRHLLWGSAIVTSFYAAQALFSLWYFGKILPNTYYLKLTGYPVALRITRGLYELGRFAWNANLLLFALPFVFAVRRDRRILLLLGMFSVQVIYNVYVGGDAWEAQSGSRYVCIAMPGFFVVLSCGLRRLSKLLVDMLDLHSLPARIANINWPPALFAVLLVFSMITFNAVSFNSIFGPDSLAQALLLQPPLLSGDGGGNQSDVRQALLIRSITKPEAKIAVVRAGTIPYFSDLYTVDELGKIDAYIAHEPMKRSSGLHRFIAFLPGHMKYDYDYSIGTLSPDLIAQIWVAENQVPPDLNKYSYQGVRMAGKCIYVRKGSENVLWGSLPAQSCP